MKIKIKKSYLIIGIILLAVAGYWYSASRPAKVEYLTAKAEKGDLTQTVSDTGTIKTADEINLNFITPGKLAKLNVKIGDNVKSGQILAEADLADLNIRIKQASASLVSAQASYNKVVNGVSREDIAISQASARQAEVGYQNSQLEYEKTKRSIEQAVTQAQQTLDELQSPTNRSANNKRDGVISTIEDKTAVAKSALDTVNRVLNDDAAKDTLSIQDSATLALARLYYTQAVSAIAPADSSLLGARTLRTDESLDRSAADTLDLLNRTNLALNYCFSALQKTITSSRFPQASLDAFKSSISGQLTAVGLAITAVQNSTQGLKDAIKQAQNALDSAKSGSDQQLASARSRVDSAFTAWQIAKAQLAKLQAPARPEDVQLAQAQVSQAQASLDSVRNQRDNYIIKAPIDGVITKTNYAVGESTVGTKAVVSMLSKNNYEIDLDISETDINKIKIGNPVEVTFDALGEEVKFSAVVSFIEPAQTVIQDVIYYKTVISDLKYPGAPANNPTGTWQIKPGMTANTIITTAKKTGVLIIPQRAVTEKENKDRVVRVLEGGQPAEKVVTIGLRGDDGLVEVLTGINTGDEVVTSVKNGTAAK